MAERPMADSPRPGDPRSSARSSTILGRPNDPTRSLATPILAAGATAVFFALGASDPRLWACALFAPFPILAVAPEIGTEIAAQFAFAAFLIGNLVAWGGAQFAVPLTTMLASHIQGAIVFATFVSIAAEATPRWSGVLAPLVFLALETAFHSSLSLESPLGTWGIP